MLFIIIFGTVSFPIGVSEKLDSDLDHHDILSIVFRTDGTKVGTFFRQLLEILPKKSSSHKHLRAVIRWQLCDKNIFYLRFCFEKCAPFYYRLMPTVTLTIIWYSITHSLFHSRLKTFSADPSNHSPSFFFFRIHYMDSPDCLLSFLSISVFYFLVFCFTLFSRRFRAVD